MHPNVRIRRAALATSISGNSKIGEAAATYAAQASCPTSCPFLHGGGCYAENGVLGKWTRALNAFAGDDTDPVAVALDEAAAIAALDVVPGRPMRLHGVGDCATPAAAMIVAAAARDYVRRGGGPVWTYTHGWRTVPRWAWGDVHVLASCETPADVDEAHRRGYASAIVVDEFPGRRRYQAGTASVLPCPAQTTHGVVCSSCRLCMDTPRLLKERLTIGFAVHGDEFTKKKARQALEDPENPDRRLTSRQLIPRELERDPTLTIPELAVRLSLAEGSVRQMVKRLRAEGVLPPLERST